MIESATPVPNTDLVLLNTTFGKVLTGTCLGTQNNVPSKCMLITRPSPQDRLVLENVSESKLEKILEKYWTLESIGITDKRVVKTKEDQEALDLFEESTTRCKDGHYEVGLPFRNKRRQLKNNCIIACRQLEATEKNLSKNPEKREAYVGAMKEYID